MPLFEDIPSLEFGFPADEGIASVMEKARRFLGLDAVDAGMAQEMERAGSIPPKPKPARPRPGAPPTGPRPVPPLPFMPTAGLSGPPSADTGRAGVLPFIGAGTPGGQVSSPLSGDMPGMPAGPDLSGLPNFGGVGGGSTSPSPLIPSFGVHSEGGGYAMPTGGAEGGAPRGGAPGVGGPLGSTTSLIKLLSLFNKGPRGSSGGGETSAGDGAGATSTLPSGAQSVGAGEILRGPYDAPGQVPADLAAMGVTMGEGGVLALPPPPPPPSLGPQGYSGSGMTPGGLIDRPMEDVSMLPHASSNVYSPPIGNEVPELAIPPADGGVLSSLGGIAGPALSALSLISGAKTATKDPVAAVPALTGGTIGALGSLGLIPSSVLGPLAFLPLIASSIISEVFGGSGEAHKRAEGQLREQIVGAGPSAMEEMIARASRGIFGPYDYKAMENLPLEFDSYRQRYLEAMRQLPPPGPTQAELIEQAAFRPGQVPTTYYEGR